MAMLSVPNSVHHAFDARSAHPTNTPLILLRGNTAYLTGSFVKQVLFRMLLFF